MDAKISNVRICGMASCVPDEEEDNYDFFNILGERKVKKQVRLTGVRKRHVANKYQRSSDFGIKAVNDLLNELDWERESIGVLIYLTQSPDYTMPSTAIVMQDRLQLSKECIAFDVNLGCSSFNYGVHTVASLLENSCTIKRGLCVIAETVPALRSRRFLDSDTVSFSMLFGAAGAAVALEKIENSEMFFSGICDGANYDAIVNYGNGLGTKMQGDKVFEFAINDVADQIMAFIGKNGLQEEDIDYYVFHQAQQLILDNIADACDLPEDKVLFSLENYGNTSGVSVPLTLCANRERVQEKSKVKVLFCGFGVGLSSGITYVELDTKHILPITTTSEHFDEDKIPLGELSDQSVIIMDGDSCMGSLLARYCDECGAKTILCGKDQSKLSELSECLCWNSDIIVYEDNDELSEKISKLSSEPDSLVGMNVMQLRTLQEFVGEKKSFVVLKDASQKGSDVTESLSGANYIEYDSSDFQWDDHVEREFAWSRRILQDGLPQAMLKPLNVCRCVIWFLRNDNKFLKDVTLRI